MGAGTVFYRADDEALPAAFFIPHTRNPHLLSCSFCLLTYLEGNGLSPIGNTRSNWDNAKSPARGANAPQARSPDTGGPPPAKSENDGRGTFDRLQAYVPLSTDGRPPDTFCFV